MKQEECGIVRNYWRPAKLPERGQCTSHINSAVYKHNSIDRSTSMFPSGPERNADWRNARPFRLPTNFGVNAYYLGAFVEPALWEEEERKRKAEFEALMERAIRPSNRTKSRFEDLFKEQERKRAQTTAVLAAAAKTVSTMKKEEPRTSARGVADIEW